MTSSQATDIATSSLDRCLGDDRRGLNAQPAVSNPMTGPARRGTHALDMRSSLRKKTKVVAFPNAPRARREQLLAMTRSALPLLEAALAEDNSTLLAGILQALGAAASGRDATSDFQCIRLGVAIVVPIGRPRTS